MKFGVVEVVGSKGGELWIGYRLLVHSSGMRIRERWLEILVFWTWEWVGVAWL